MAGRVPALKATGRLVGAGHRKRYFRPVLLCAEGSVIAASGAGSLRPPPFRE